MQKFIIVVVIIIVVIILMRASLRYGLAIGLATNQLLKSDGNETEG